MNSYAMLETILYIYRVLAIKWNHFKEKHEWCIVGMLIQLCGPKDQCKIAITKKIERSQIIHVKHTDTE